MELVKPKVAVCAALLLLLLLSSYDKHGGVVEARLCTGKSQHHSFPCVSDKHCTSDCVREYNGGWTAGYCHWRVCTCQKAC
ncbi:defensin-like protein 2 [Brachypodium distachyon]|uniref:Knottins-like domain-containing protein n=1 Tax=Brachypodium distachyon TaxID=15368 RepID=I1I1W9_BRADI|nr:defensin-like protein 2 [Brachypodium distachyon]KQJ95569.1 hypothetical protein BRADI_3g17842v3 [Brachypodium distachyon]|eukprot:XP_003573541.1 defensin-like protein 2 [Brachypodium distachyon]